MFERYSLFEIGKLIDRYKLPSGVPKGVKPKYNISPTQLAPVVVMRDGVRVMESMKWGFVRYRAKDTNSVFRYKTFIAKSEDIFKKNQWEHVAPFNRCLIPVNGFYEWKKVPGDKEAYHITTGDRGLFTLAGVYSSWVDPEGKEWGTFAVVTTKASKELSPLGERMPVILNSEDEAIWLDKSIDDTDALFGLTRSHSFNSTLNINRVGPEVFSAKANKPSLIAKLK